jgi:hypothetical protein
MRDAVPRFLLTTTVALGLSLQVALGGTASGRQLLTELHQGLESARAMPRGSSPFPSAYQEISGLIGVSRSDVARVLGSPTYCGTRDFLNDSSPDCGTKSFWAYRWGPPPPEPHLGPGGVDSTTGGPWLLLLDFSSGQVSAARWQGQR